jgi:hypothetical protein
MSKGFRATVRILGLVLMRPFLWPVAIRTVVALASRGWWRRKPFMPLPPGDYLAFRLQTQYGGAGTSTLEPNDVLKYLQWLRKWA